MRGKVDFLTMVVTTGTMRILLFPTSPRTPPRLKRHDAMVEDMEEGEVGELLLEHEEDGVGKVDELGDVEDPGEVESSNRLGIVRVINRLTG